MIPNGTRMKFTPQSCLILLVPQRLKTSAISYVSEGLA